MAAFVFLCRNAMAASTTPSPKSNPVTAQRHGQPVTVHFPQDFIYAPTPAYRGAARRADATGKGVFRLNFDDAGKVKSITILQSTKWKLLDDAALQTLVRWRAKPGMFYSVTVPVSFRHGN